MRPYFSTNNFADQLTNLMYQRNLGTAPNLTFKQKKNIF